MNKPINYTTAKTDDGAADKVQPPRYRDTLPTANFSAYSTSRKAPLKQSVKLSGNNTPFFKRSEYKLAIQINLLNGSVDTFSDDDHTVGVLNPDDAFSIENIFGRLAYDKPTMLRLQGLETARDPRLLLRRLRKILKQNDSNRLEIVASIAVKSEMNGLPNNPSYVRIWNPIGLKQFLVSSGFIIHQSATSESSLLLTVSADEISHSALLEKYGFPKPKFSMIITTEHADTPHTGGIGSYIKEVELIDLKNKPIVMFCNHEHFNKITTLKNKSDNIIDIHDLDDEATIDHTTEWGSLSTSVYVAVKNLLYLYDQIQLVEYQEYLGPGARLAAAKKSGEVPLDVTLVARCHGSQIYIDRAAQNWSGIEIGDVFELERMSIRYADIVSSPTRYLRDLYQSTGYDFEFKSSPILRLPYQYPEATNEIRKNITKIAFVGKRNKMKGYEDFCATALEITDPDNRRYCPEITEVIVLGAHVAGCEEQDKALLNVLKDRDIHVTMEQLPRSELLELYKKRFVDTLFVLPYGGDNHPVVVLEMMAYSCAFICYDAGGVPELIPNKYLALCTVPPDQSWLAEKVKDTYQKSPSELGLEIGQLRGAAVREQININKRIALVYKSGYPEVTNSTTPDIILDASQQATVMVPCYDTRLEYVKILIHSLNAQITPPSEILFIDDKSTTPGYGKKLEKLVSTTLRLPYRIITHEKNLGLSGARNTGLYHCKTAYLINIDSDDVASPSFITDYVNIMDRNPEYAAAVCGLESFSDTDDWNQSKDSEDAYRYTALGDCFVLGITKNVFGHAGSCVRVSAAREIGGWDASDRSMWEDWAFYLKLTGRGEKILAFPKINYFYRVTPGSMLRSYPEYPATQRIVRNLGIVNIWESQRLYAYLKEGTRLALSSPPPQIIQVEPSSRSYKALKRIESKIHTVFHKYPGVHTASKKALKRLGI